MSTTPESPAVALEYSPSVWRRFLGWKSQQAYYLKERVIRFLLNLAFKLHGKGGNLVRHAESEMRFAGLYDEAADYGGMLPQAVLDLVYVHSMQGHSGFSHKMVLQIFNKVADFKTLTPLTDNPDEWLHHDHTVAGHDCWQSKRMGSCFSTDGGKSYYDIDDPEYVHFDLIKDPDTGEEYKSYYTSLPPVDQRTRHLTVAVNKGGDKNVAGA